MDDSGYAGVGAGVWILCLAIMAFYVWTMWRVFEKAGKPGWAAIVPIYNLVIMLEMAGKPLWWVLLFFVPLVNIIIGWIALAQIARNFGKGTGFALGLIFLGFIFWPILAFGNAEYRPVA